MIEHWKPKDIYDYQKQSFHFFVIFMIQRLLTTSLQASFLGISKNLHNHVDLMTLLNVLLGCVLGVITIYSEVFLHLNLTEELRGRWEKMRKEVAAAGANKR